MEETVLPSSNNQLTEYPSEFIVPTRRLTIIAHEQNNSSNAQDVPNIESEVPNVGPVFPGSPVSSDEVEAVIQMMDLYHTTAAREFKDSLPMFAACIQDTQSITSQFLTAFQVAMSFFERDVLVQSIDYYLWLFLLHLSQLKTCLQSFMEIRLPLMDTVIQIRSFGQDENTSKREVIRSLGTAAILYHTFLLEYGRNQSLFMQQLVKYLQVSLQQADVKIIQEKALKAESTFFSLQVLVVQLTFVLFKFASEDKG